MDCASTAVTQGAKDVYLVYRRSFQEMPAWPEERDALLQQGVHLMILTQPLDYVVNSDGVLEGMKVVRTELSDPDDSGRRKPVAVAGAESVMNVDFVVEAIGQELDADSANEVSSVASPDGGPLAKSGSLATSNETVFCAGDLMSGGTTVVQSVREGMSAAESISESL